MFNIYSNVSSHIDSNVYLNIYLNDIQIYTQSSYSKLANSLMQQIMGTFIPHMAVLLPGTSRSARKGHL